MRAQLRTAGEGLLVLGCAALVGTLLATERAQLFVGSTVRALLWVTAPTLALVGLWTLVHAARMGRPAPAATLIHSSPADHDHHGGSRVAWLVVLPVVAGLVLPLRPLGLLGATTPRHPATHRSQNAPVLAGAATGPQAPGSPPPVAIDARTGKTVGGYDNGGDDAGSSRNGPTGPAPTSWTPLAGNPAPVDLYDYISRADDPAGIKTLRGHRITLVGFASADPDQPERRWVIARLKMWCCVADALPFMVTMVDAPQRPPAGSWFRATGTWLPSDANGDANFHVEQVQVIPTPSNPYL